MKLLWGVIAVAFAAFLYFVRRGRSAAITAQVQRQIEAAQANLDAQNLDDMNVAAPEKDAP